MTATEYFNELETLYVTQNNSCPTACSFCYSDKGADFTIEQLDRIWEWYKCLHNGPERYFGFMGFNPSNDNILGFLDLLKGENHRFGVVVRMDINGCDFSVTKSTHDLDVDYLNKFLSYPSTMLVVKTDAEDIDVFDAIVKLPRSKVRSKVVVNTSNYHLLDAYLKKALKTSVVNVTCHIVNYKVDNSMEEWKPEQLAEIEKVLMNAVNDGMNIDIDDAGMRSKTNCFTAKYELAVDNKGDYYGCYVFSNGKHKDKLDTRLGNIFTGEHREDLIKKFENEFNDSLKTDPKCSTCDLSGFCYRCPTGMIIHGNDYYGSTDNCQEVVKILQRINLQTKLRNATKKIVTSINQPMDVDAQYAAILKKHFGMEVTENKDARKYLKYKLGIEHILQDGRTIFQGMVENFNLYSVQQLERFPAPNREVLYCLLIEFVLDNFNLTK